MDLLTTLTFVRPKKKEGFSDDDSSVVNVIGSIVSIIVGCFAVYLSWTCNTAMGVNVVLKIVFAFFAFIFGIIYLIFYLIFNMGRCMMPSSMKQ